MTLFNRFLVSSLLTGGFILYAQISCADSMNPQYQSLPMSTRVPEQTYGANVKDKALHGIANITTGWLEIPKSIINTTNSPDGNLAFGVVGGVVKGLLETGARTGSGFLDLVTAPFPTKPIAQPDYIWKDFDQDTSYGPILRPEVSKKRNQQDVPVSH